MITSRPALASDAAAIAPILRSSMRTAMPWLPDLHTPDEDLWFIENKILPDRRVTVAAEAGQVIGYMARSASGDWVEHLYLLPSHWRRGIGTELLRRAQVETKELQLWAFQRNLPARRFYERAVEITDGSRNEEKTPDVRYLWRADGSQFAAELKGWLCEVGGQVVGSAIADRSDGELEVLAVRPCYEGFGIGRRLLKRAVAWLRNEGCSPIWLCANPDPNLRASSV